MCGILGLVHRSVGQGTAVLREATRIVRHRGPDDEGFLLWTSGARPTVFAGEETASSTRDELRLSALPAAAPWRVAFGHRRLSIVDLSPAGHQPMVHEPSGLAIVYNGEIYNHLELRSELERLGHRLRSHSDTEVILAAWAEWGPGCLDRLNGMFAFLILDPRRAGTLHVVRDRFGVKPLYWARVGEMVAFASEIKQIRELPGYVPRVDMVVARDYLLASRVDDSSRTFDVAIHQLLGGERLEISLEDGSVPIAPIRWYDLPRGSFRGSRMEAAAELLRLLSDSVSLRLRADVPVGSCLSGGLDSSAIVCLAREALETRGDHAGQVTVTARFEQLRFDEWTFAEQVVRRTGATSVEVWPTFDRLRSELDQLIWHLDEPFASTSMFSQWCVFAAAAQAGLKVMLDGQGSDEQLAGYGGNEVALYTGLMRRFRTGAMAREAFAFRRRHGVFPLAQLVLASRNVAPALDAVLPQRVRLAPAPPSWFRGAVRAGASRAPRDLNESLRQQTLSSSLPSLLRYEDRNSMARSVESRVPFLDYRLVEFLAVLPDTYKLRAGETKAVLREALVGTIPEDVRNRRDKMGFVTPEQVWLTQTHTDWFRDEMARAADAAPSLLDPGGLARMLDDMVAGRRPFAFEPWRVICFGRWLRSLGDPVLSRTDEHALEPEAEPRCAPF